jgi:hypothetical protein
MATFQTQLQSLAGAQSSPDTTAMTDWLTSGAREVLNLLPPNKLMRIASTSTFENTIDVEGKKVLGVLRKDADNSNKLMPCRQVAPIQKGRIQDSNYMEYATASDPAFWIDGDTLQVFPTSASTNDMSLVYINAGITVSHNDSNITNFPDEAEHAVVLFAAKKYLQKLLSDNEDEFYQIQYTMIDKEYQLAIQALRGGA